MLASEALKFGFPSLVLADECLQYLLDLFFAVKNRRSKTIKCKQGVSESAAASASTKEGRRHGTSSHAKSEAREAQSAAKDW